MDELTPLLPLMTAGYSPGKNLQDQVTSKFVSFFEFQATEKDVLWVMRASMVVFGALAAALAFYSHSIYDLWFLGGELVYTLLFPQLCCVLFISNTNTYGSAAGFFFGFLLRLLAGEPSLKIPPLICYPGCSLVDGVYVQRFPFKTVTMLATLLTIISVSYLAAFAFKRNLLPHKWDVCQLIKEESVFISLPQREKQTDAQKDINDELVEENNSNRTS